mmetsp:Transcript_4037/g.6814  ORF Transcript_4037/g.6814 Transcript_4037/m.6814 type:complete len:339 (+) Transcript_4037:36-1052(+)
MRLGPSIQSAAVIFWSCACLAFADDTDDANDGLMSVNDGLMVEDTNMVEVSHGGLHSCAVVLSGDDAGVVSCWGNGDQGQLGDGREVGAEVGANAPVMVVGLQNATQVSAGGLHSCALEDVGLVKCWGDGRHGQLGYGGMFKVPRPIQVRDVQNAIVISAGGSHSCALEQSGRVRCWGWGMFGQLGHGLYTKEPVRTPVTVTRIDAAVDVSAGALHACAAEATGEVKCWGYGGDGQLGNGKTTDSSRPVVVKGVSDAAAVAVGHRHSCAKKHNGEHICWGKGAEERMTTDSTGQFERPSDIWRSTASQGFASLEEALSGNTWTSTPPPNARLELGSHT